MAIKLELVAAGPGGIANAAVYLQGLTGALVAIRARDGSQEGWTKGGTVRAVNDIGIELTSPTGSIYGFPWDAIEEITVSY